MMMLIHILFTFVSSRPAYETSLFGKPGTNEVEIDLVDGFEVLETGLPKPQTKPVSEAGWTDYIAPEDYPWPGHNFVGGWEGNPSSGTCHWTTLLKETNQIRSFYNRTNVTQVELFWHPAAAKQFYTTDEALNKADRVKVRFVLTPRMNRHYCPIYVPPGELATIDIQKNAIEKVTVTFNKYMSDIWTLPDKSPKYRQRLDNTRIDEIPLSYSHNTLGLPYGMIMNFNLKVNDPVELIISGGILCPFFKYGVHSDEEWENDLSKRPGPVAILESGNIIFSVPSYQIRGTYRMNDCMRFYRSAYQISQTTAKDGYNPYDSRPLNLLELNYETFVPAGAAVAFVGRNFCQFPPDWITTIVSWSGLQAVPWGNLHEINHHHQGNWGMTGTVDEMSNNMLNLIIMAQTNQASSLRYTADWGSYAYSTNRLNDNNEYGLSMYSNMLHFFGIEKTRKFIRTDQENSGEYDRNKIGRRGAEMLRASKIFGRNMRYHFNFHNYNDSTIEGGRPEVWEELNKLNLPMFHPVSTVYTVGFIVDGERFISARPFEIPPYDNEIDFVGNKIQRQNTQWFGDHEFVKANFENGRLSAWREISKGKYMLTPKEDFNEIEEVIVDYLDKTTNITTQAICQFKQKNGYASYKRYSNIGRTEIFNAYNMTKTIEPVESYNVPLIRSPPLSTDETGWISITKGSLVPPNTKEYVFALASDDQGLFYLSDKSLSGDQKIDEPFLINYQPTYNFNYVQTNRSNPILLNEGKLYFFILVIYNTPGKSNQGQGIVGYQTGVNSFANVPEAWLRYKPVDDEKVYKKQYVPKFQNMIYMDEWDGPNFLPIVYPKWNTYKYPIGNCIINSNNGQGSFGKQSISECLTDDNPYTEYRTKWWSGDGPVQQFPHVYETDIGETATFPEIKIGGTGNRVWFDMDCFIELRLAPDNFTIIENGMIIPYNPNNYSLDHNESIIYSGRYITTSPTIKLDKKYSGKYLRLTIWNNSKSWKDGNKGRSSISSIELGTGVYGKKVYPMTNTKLLKYKQEWKETRGGVYYNGKGYTGTEKQSVEICVLKGRSEVVIIGDYYPNMGSATVTIDKKYAGKIRNSTNVKYDEVRLNLSSRSHKTILFYDKVDPSISHNIKITVDKDSSITLSGILMEEKIIDDVYYDDEKDDKNDYSTCQFESDDPDGTPNTTTTKADTTTTDTTTTKADTTTTDTTTTKADTTTSNIATTTSGATGGGDSQSNNNKDNGKNSSKTFIIIGVIAGVVAVIVAIIVGVIIFKKRSNPILINHDVIEAETNFDLEI